MGHGECAGVLSSHHVSFYDFRLCTTTLPRNRTTRAGSVHLPVPQTGLARIGLSDRKHGSWRSHTGFAKIPMAAYSATEHFLRREGS